MATVMDINFNSNPASPFGFDAVTDPHGDLTMAAGAALAGTAYGMNCHVANADTGVSYGLIAITQSSLHRARFYIDPNTLGMATNGYVHVAILQQSASPFRTLYKFILNWNGSTYRVSFEYMDDGGTNNEVTKVNISDGEHRIEIYEVRATNETSNDGTISWWIDGTPQTGVTGLDNYNIMTDLGWRYYAGNNVVGTGTLGDYFLDEFKANDDGSEIGPAGGGGITVNLDTA